MTVSKMMTVAAVLATTAYAGPAAETVTIYLDNTGIVPQTTMMRSKVLASDMFAKANVRIQWRTGQPSQMPSRTDRTLLVHLSDRIADNVQPGAFAFALPYEGVHITVFYDRVQRASSDSQTAAVLAHVLVHEITHILQGVARHSETGIMKAHWALADYSSMTQKPFSFTEEDVDLIHMGLNARTAGTAPVLVAAK